MSGPAAPSTTPVTSDDLVVVVGAGPVGLSTALGLARRGARVLVLERGAGPGTASRASTFHPATLEFLAELDVVDEVIERGLVAPKFQHRDRDHGIVAEFDLTVLSDDTAYPFRVQLEQDKFCTLLADHLADFPSVEIRYDTKVVEATQHADGVTVTSDTGEAFGGQWLVAADGAHSHVRRSLGIEQEGFTYGQRFLVLSTSHDLRDDLPDLAPVNYVSDPDEWLVLLRTPDHWRILFPVDEDVTDASVTTPEALQARIAGVVGHDGPFEVLQHSHYEIHQMVATTFRDGRVLLAGDAAHLNNPLGGLGMNTGMADARSVVSRLGDVLAGADADECLDGYSDLRRRLAIDVTDRETRANFDRMQQRDPELRAAQQQAMRDLVADPVALRAHLMKTSLLEAAREGV